MPSEYMQRLDRLGAVLDLFGLYAHRLAHLEGDGRDTSLGRRATQRSLSPTLCRTTVAPKACVMRATCGERRSARTCGRLVRLSEPVCRSITAEQCDTTSVNNECAMRVAELPFGLPGK